MTSKVLLKKVKEGEAEGHEMLQQSRPVITVCIPEVRIVLYVIAFIKNVLAGGERGQKRGCRNRGPDTGTGPEK